MKHDQVHRNNRTKGMSILIALLFLFNLLAVIPLSINHPKENGVSHSVSTELAELSHSQDKSEHDHVEHCGMVQCTIALSDYNPTLTASIGEKTRFTMAESDLGTLHHIPPGRPPLA